MHIAAYHGVDDVLEELLGAGQDPDPKMKNGLTPLHIAVAKGGVNTIRVLLRAGADINAIESRGRTPLFLAAQNVQENATEELLKWPLLLELADDHIQTPLFLAAINGHTNIVRMLLNSGADIYHRRFDQHSVLDASVLHGHVDTLREIVSRHLGNKDLLDAPSRQGHRPLHFTNWRGIPELASILLDAGADINSRADDGATPLHQAVEAGNLEIVKLLVSRNARTDLPASHGLTLLQAARVCQFPDIVAFLRDKGVE